MGFITQPIVGAYPADDFHGAFNEPISDVDKGEVSRKTPKLLSGTFLSLIQRGKFGPN